MTKQDVLAALAEAGEADATEVADTLGVPYATSAMALVRLVRQGLAGRRLNPHRGTYAYWVTDHGQARLAFFEEQEQTRQPWTDTPNRSTPLKGGPLMKRKKLHTGTYHCPACFVELDLVGEESLKCDQCGGPLARGGLDEVWADDEEEEE